MGELGLVLTGGGARAAYQVGVLKAIAEILGARESPFRVLAGGSAGAINAVSLALEPQDFGGSVDRLAESWLSLTPDRVYRTDVTKLLSIGSRWVRDLSAGAVFGRSRINYLLDTEPLRNFLHGVLPMERISEHVAAGRLRGVAVSVTSYDSGLGISFFEAVREVKPWVRSTRVGVRSPLRLEHVMASAAIPLFFPPVRIRGAFYGDGCVRMNSPLSPAIHLGAERVVAIGVRHARAPEDLAALRRARRRSTLSPSDIAGVLMNAVLLEALEADVERLERINRTVSLIPPEQRARMSFPLRVVPALVLRPSRDLGELAQDQYKRFPRTLRYLLKGIGAHNGNGSDLLSYLAFEPVYIGRLVDLGYRDTMGSRDEVERFFHDEARPRVAPWRGAPRPAVGDAPPRRERA